MRTLKTFCTVAMLALLVGCSSGGDEDTLSIGNNNNNDGDDDGPPPVVIASLEVLTSNPQIPSDGGVPVTITALLRDANNNFVAGENVTFAADSGGLS
ncbi:MAG: Ig-like domain-containing protein, partial [Pseudomonadota bacterium]